MIANAMDGQPVGEREEGVAREFAGLRKLGLRPVEVDLRAYFGRQPDVIEAELARFPAVWVRGGNVFMARYALARSGADTALRALLRRDALVYGGYSAGPCVLGPSLDGLERCDDPGVVPAVYGDPAVREGVGLLDYAIVPHVDSPGHPGTALLGEVAEAYRVAGVPHLALRDGQALVVNGPHQQVY